MPFLTPLLALIIGILIGESIQLPAWGVLPILAACCVYLYILRKSSTPLLALKHNKKHLVWIFLLFTGIGIFDAAFQKPSSYKESNINNYILAEGEIIEAKSFASGDRFVVEVLRMVDSLSGIRNFHNFKILLSSDGFSADPGDIIVFPSRFTAITDNPNLRSTGFADRMRKAGIYYLVRVKEGEINIKGFNNTLSNSAIIWRNKCISKIEKSSLSRSTCDFLVALLLGERSFLSEEVRNNFSNAGVAHVLALSGLHVTIVMGIFLLVLLPLKLLGLHRLRYILALAAIWSYAFFTGMSLSTVRACIMTTFVVAAIGLQRRNTPENALLASAFIILLITPRALFDIGMQLSFLCVGSILFFAEPLNPVNRKNHPKFHSFVAAVLVTLVATITTWVVVSFYFQSIPLLFLPVNLCILPLLPIFIWIACIYIVLLLLGFDSSMLSWILNNGYDFIEWIALNLSAFGKATVTINIQLPIVILWFLGIMILAYAIKKRHSNKYKLIMIGGSSLMVLALICIPFLCEKPQDGIIFQKNSNDISLALYDGDKPSLSVLPRNTVSRLIHKGCEVLSIDCAVDFDSISKILASSTKRRRRYLVIGSGFKESTLKEIPKINNFDKIILHSSMKRKMETKLRQEAVEMGLKSIYSLREEGPLEELLPDSLLTIR